ncbi:MAG: DAK2 domain-containing protein, partial [Synechococcaceae cyanobacterium ELA182]
MLRSVGGHPPPGPKPVACTSAGLTHLGRRRIRRTPGRPAVLGRARAHLAEARSKNIQEGLRRAEHDAKRDQPRAPEPARRPRLRPADGASGHRPHTGASCGLTMPGPGPWCLIEAVALTLIEHADELTELDRAIGDGDHGINMKRGAEAVLAKADSLAGLPLAELLCQ